MTNLNKTSMPEGENVSELEMVGALLFGSISDLDSVQENRMVNLGARIAPANAREWTAEETVSESLLSTAEAAELSEIAPERKAPRPVQEFDGNGIQTSMPVESVFEPVSAEETSAPVVSPECMVRPEPRNTHKIFLSGAIAVLSVCVAVLGWQLYAEKSETQTVKENAVAESEETPSNAAVETSEAVETPEVQAPELVNTPAVSAFAAVPAETPEFDQPMPAQPEIASAYPQFNAEAGTVPQSVHAETNSAIGSAVMCEETYPTFNADLAQTALQTPADAPALCAQNPVYSPSGSVDPVSGWNVGAPMEEVPVFNSELSSFDPPAAAPLNVVPTAPQIGTQAQVPPTPRKLTVPQNGQQSVPQAHPYQIQAAPAVQNVPAEEAYPTFDPNMGAAAAVDSSLPVTYY
ncbi:MAG: hypothetical protein IJD43_15985 [Thermoguttaceae bacterium]|nr:hypothetical protein [Thermoguttaceae bacterium]